MDKSAPAKDPESYVDGLIGWQRTLVESLRAAVTHSGELDERIKWGHLVYSANGPVLLIRADGEQVIFGFWRGQRMTDLEPRLKAGGKYEMARVDYNESDVVDYAVAGQLARRGVELNQELGDPTQVVLASKKK